MKIGKIIQKINDNLAREIPGFNSVDHITAAKINGYRQQDLIFPPVKKHSVKFYYYYNEENYELIYRAYKLIITQDIKTRSAFKKARSEILKPTIF